MAGKSAMAAPAGAVIDSGDGRHYGVPSPDHRRRSPAALLAVLVAAANVALWALFNPPLAAPDLPADTRFAGLAYGGYQRWDNALAAPRPNVQQLAADLELLRHRTGRLRTYSAAGFPELPRLAEQAGLDLALGVWLDRRDDNNERELAAALAATRSGGSVRRIIAGNETLLHGWLEPDRLYRYLDRLRASLAVPVSTAEPWHVWLDRPELARHVDFITVHLLPYWEGAAVSVGVDLALRRYRELRARFPDKPVVIGEIGWPAQGAAIGQARASAAAQALFVRTLLERDRSLGLDYYLMEAIDQPWKQATEGAAGAHWGLFDAARRLKVPLAGPAFDDRHWAARALVATLLALAITWPFLLRFAHLRLAGRVTFAVGAQAAISAAVLFASVPLAHYPDASDVAALAVLTPVLVFATLMLLAQTFEFVELFWPGGLRAEAAPAPATAAELPRVSIHLACCNEPPAQVITAIDSLLALDWPALEVVVVDNNTTDDSRWQPVAAHVERRRREIAATGRRSPVVHHFRLRQWPGYKAGALNFALAHCDPRAQWIGVVDADYRVHADWLRSLGGYFGDRGVGIIQAPQAHRDWQAQPLQRMMNWEYEGFFRIGMHHRHERDAIVQHGTMTLIRARALRDAGGWNEACIVEDTELGLRLLERGLRAVYVDRVYGTGLVPADFAAFRRQRQRWAHGGMQILRAHGRRLLGRSGLSLGQRYHFLAGWLPWIGDALHLLFTLAAVIWSVAMLSAPARFGPPLLPFLVPLAASFIARAAFGPLLYWRRVRCARRDIAGAAVVGMGLSHAIARGVVAGLAGGKAVFQVTRRGRSGGDAAPGWLRDVREEAALLSALLVAAGALALRLPATGDGGVLWLCVLVLQALPYAAAIGCAALGRAVRSPAIREPAVCAEEG